MPFSHTKSTPAAIGKLKRELGPLRVRTIEARDLAQAHARLGKLRSAEINQIVHHKINQISKSKFEKQIRFVRSCAVYMQRIKRVKAQKIIKEYFVCLNAWALGAQLDKLCEKLNQKVDGAAVTHIDIALWLQNDNVGCQTGMIRNKRGGAYVWHMEEDTLGYISHTEIIEFRIGTDRLWTFVYPYLLPGGAFAWRKNFFQSIDFLYIKKKLPQGGTLANVGSWACLWFGHINKECVTVLKALFPFYDGYALNTVDIHNKQIRGHVLEYGAEIINEETLGTNMGSYLFHVNCIFGDGLKQFKKYVIASKKTETRMRNRVIRAEHMIRALDLDNISIPQDMVKMLSSRKGGEYAYCNVDVKAYVIGICEPDAWTFYVGVGPAQVGDQLKKFLL